MQLIKFVPDFLKTNRAYQALCEVLELELAILENRLNAISQESFIKTAEDEGLTRWETILGLEKIDDTENRRLNILAYTTAKRVLTEKSLRMYLDFLLGKGSYKLQIDAPNFSLTIRFRKPSFKLQNILNEWMRKNLPANLVWQTIFTRNKYQEVGQISYERCSNYTFTQLEFDELEGVIYA